MDSQHMQAPSHQTAAEEHSPRRGEGDREREREVRERRKKQKKLRWEAEDGTGLGRQAAHSAAHPEELRQPASGGNEIGRAHV